LTAVGDGLVRACRAYRSVVGSSIVEKRAKQTASEKRSAAARKRQKAAALRRLLKSLGADAIDSTAVAAADAELSGR
jgi:hypothetical protein